MMVRCLEIEGDPIDLPTRVARMTKPYRTASKKDWEGFKEFYEGNPEALFFPLTVNGDTCFHIAASYGDTKLLQDLLRMVPDYKMRGALTLQDQHGNTALHEVATTDNVEAVELLINKLRTSTDGPDEMEERDIPRKVDQLLKVKNKLGETPLYRAAALGKTKMVHYLAEEIVKVSGNIYGHFYRYDSISILHMAVLGQHFDIAIWLLKKDRGLGNGKEMKGLTCFHLIALIPSAFKSTCPLTILKKLVYWCLPTPYDKDVDEAQLPTSKGEDLEIGKSNDGLHHSKKRTAISRMCAAIWSPLIKGCPLIKKIWEEKEKHESALKLVKLLVKQDTSWKDSKKTEQDCTISLGLGKGGKKPSKTEEGTIEATSSGNSSGSSPEVPLLIAARTGIVEIVDEILNAYPQAIDHVSENEQNILHLAIMHRQYKIFKLIKHKVLALDKLASKIDNNGNTILHHVADKTYYPGGTRAGPALQFEEELLWFRRVEKIMPPHYVMHRNKNKITAQDLFKEQHEDQLKKAQTWIKETSESCSTVAVLVATVVFAAAYTVPGGSDDKGLPNFLHSPLFVVFTVMDVVSLACSLTSVVMFLSILTSSLEQEEFLHILPRKLTVGFAFLFFSVMTTMITFTASLLLIIRIKKRLTSAFVYTAAFIPVAVFALMQFSLYVEFLGLLKKLLKDIRNVLPVPKKKKRKGV